MGLWSRLTRTFRGGSHRADIDEELQFHLEMDVAEGRGAREARLRLGNVARIAEDTRATGILDWLESVLRDVRYAGRQLRKSPALTIAVVLSLTIGLGANTAIFSLIDAAVLKPLPVAQPRQLMVVEWTADGFPPGVENINGEVRPIAGNRRKGSSVAARIYRRLAHEQTAFAALVGVADADTVAIGVDGSPADTVNLQFVGGNFFQGIGSLPILGRPFREDEDRVGVEPAVVVSHRFWVNRLASDPAAVDRVVRINNVPARIAGVARPGFFGLTPGLWTDVYAPLGAKVAFMPRQNTPNAENEHDWWVRQIGRVKPDVAEADARAALDSLFRGIVAEENPGIAADKIPTIVTRRGERGFDALNAADASALRILLVLVVVLLLVVCANVANLLLSRSVSRQRESALRVALGAARSRLFRQHVIESGILAVLGCAGGLAFGYVAAQGIHRVFQTGRNASYAFDLHLDLRTVGFSVLLSIVATCIFGLAPALRYASAGLNDALKAQTRSVVGGRLRLPRLLVSIQMALCLAALVAAGLLGRSLANLKWTDVGFDRERVAYASVNPSRAGYTRDRLAPYAERVREELSKLPGVDSVALTSFRPLSSLGNNGAVNLAGRSFDPARRANMHSVGDGFFETVGIPLVAGRTFDRRDMRPDSSAAVVDESFATQYFPNENPLGRRFAMSNTDNDRLEIVGVVRSTAYNDVRNIAYPTVYETYRPGGTIHFAIRSSGESGNLREAIRKAVASIDPAVPLTEFHTQRGLIDRILRTERLLGILSGAFGLVALLLAAIGLGGLLAYAVARRTSEIGVRMALGAAGGDMIRMVLRDSLTMVGAGAVLGIPCAYAIARVLRGSLFRLEPLDPTTSVAALGALLTIAVVAAWLPARRAAAVDPLVALREE